MFKLTALIVLKFSLLMLGFTIAFAIKKFKFFAEDITNRIADWSVTYTFAFLAFVTAQPVGNVSEEYIVIFKSVAAIITGMILTIAKLVIEFLFNKYIKKK